MGRGEVSTVESPRTRALVVLAGTAPRQPLLLDRGYAEHLTGGRERFTELEVRRIVIEAGTVPGPVHLHRRAETSLLVLVGELEVRIGSNRRTLVTGDALFVPAGVAHATHNTGNVNCVALIIHDIPCEDDDPSHSGIDPTSAPPTPAIG